MDIERERGYEEFVDELGIGALPDEVKLALFERFDGGSLDADFVKICDKGDYEAAYESFAKYEEGFSEEFRHGCSFDDFVKEMKKGYCGSDITQISRLLETDLGIFYDNSFT